MVYDSINELVVGASGRGLCISDLIIEQQALELDCAVPDLNEKMAENLKVMKEAIDNGVNSENRSISGLSGGDASKLAKSLEKGVIFGGESLTKILIKALAVSEVNACMGRIVSAPTAGSCGIIPAVLLTAMEEKNLSEEAIIKGLFTAAGIGMIIARRASISGAEAGCQAECGSASAMAAGALVEVLGGTPYMVANASAIALKNTLGLACDPVAGLVEIPCIKRNALSAANALASAVMALAGIETVIPVDEVIDAMKSVGDQMPVSLKETAKGGLAATPTGQRLAEEILKKR
jgi:L-serine dehydratase